ncbi:MAG: prepilin-type N-terminal cleavage/methylation domain-containing protein [Desulfuromonadales bacterium]|nr:prepilin-type N-terminal cleavage/methylation domain-containing protein [Desulfuromonadales bacterium]MBN2793145.1 prepilin-type N-terminal cleavage/methylation domain-containing protein [Desulfuromonadales bacterium]
MRAEGFTLIELVVIILVLGILAAVAAPKFFNLSGYQERAAYDEVAGAVRYAQKLAVASGCEVQVELSGNSYALQQHATDCTTGSFVTISGHPITANNFSGVTVSASPSSFVFDAMGRTSNPVAVTVGGYSFNVIAETGSVDAP